MPKKVFFSFHYDNDNWRVSQVRNIGAIEGDPVVSDNKWEEIKKGGDKAIQKWIDDNLAGRSCTIVLVGSKTAKRKWIEYEIEKSWKDGKGVFGIYIHKLKNKDGVQDTQGQNPFENIKIDGKKLSTIVKCYDSTYSSSTYVYDDIKENIEDWITESIRIRKDAD
jgi:hypothetical protein